MSPTSKGPGTSSKLNKADADSSKFIGTTHSGKMVYDNIKHPEHSDFDSQDHTDAAQLHKVQMHKLAGALSEHSMKSTGSVVAKSLDAKIKDHSVSYAFHTAMAKHLKKG